MCAYLTQLFITVGLQRVGATLGTALSYLTVVWGMALGYLIFHEVRLPCCQLEAALLMPSRSQPWQPHTKVSEWRVLSQGLGMLTGQDLWPCFHGPQDCAGLERWLPLQLRPAQIAPDCYDVRAKPANLKPSAPELEAA